MVLVGCFVGWLVGLFGWLVGWPAMASPASLGPGIGFDWVAVGSCRGFKLGRGGGG